MKSPFYLIAGLGKTGHSIARYLQRRQQPFVVFDTRFAPDNLHAFQTEFPGVDVFLQTLPEALFNQITTVISSPGVSLEEPVLQKIQAHDIPIIGDIECLAREINVPIIAITGTNGKSTVTTLVGEMAKAAGIAVAVAGNIGTPVLDLLDDEHQYDLWVLELSSFQLDLTHTLAPIAATILNITPDHLDRHHTLNAYVEAKQRIYQHAACLLSNRDDNLTTPPLMMEQVSGKTLVSYGLNTPTENNWGIITKNQITYLAKGDICLLPVDQLRIKGKHNWANALAACALADVAGISIASMLNVLQSFSGLPHRSQWLRTIDKVDFINDSKGTNIGATISAITGIGSALQGKIVLIAGGQGKGADFNELRESISEYVRAVILIGEDAFKIQQALHTVVDLTHATSLVQAVGLAQKTAKPGDVVLLSPACASLDMFRDFNHRGEVFADAVSAL